MGDMEVGGSRWGATRSAKGLRAVGRSVGRTDEQIIHEIEEELMVF